MIAHEAFPRGHKTCLILDTSPKMFFSKLVFNREPLNRAYAEKSRVQLVAARCERGSGEFNDFFVLSKH